MIWLTVLLTGKALKKCYFTFRSPQNTDPPKQTSKYPWNLQSTSEKLRTFTEQKQTKANNLFIRNYFISYKLVEFIDHILWWWRLFLIVIKHCSWSLVTMCWMHFPFAVPREQSSSHWALPAWLQVQAFTQSCLGGLLHQNNLPLPLRILQLSQYTLLLLCSQPPGWQPAEAGPRAWSG